MGRPVREFVLELVRARDAGDAFEFRFEGQEYLVREAGGTYRTIWVPWDAALLAELAAARVEPAAAQRVGDRLAALLAPAGFAAAAEAIAAATPAAPVLLTIRAAAAELFALPWELTTLGASGRHLAETPGCCLRYAWPGAAQVAAACGDAPPRIVLAWSAAGGAVPAAAHQEAIASACAAVGLDAVETLPHVTPRRLAAALARPGRPPSVLHVLCHGVRQGLVWEDEEGRAALIDAASLRALLAPHAEHLRLVVLCACAGADPGALGDHLGSTAQALHRAGIACVLASRDPLSAAGSEVLAQALYPALLAGHEGLERALLRVRAAMVGTAGRDWLSLQLYSSEEGGDARPIALRPYRGLLAFDAPQRGLFFGREEEVRQLAERLAEAAEREGGGLQVVVGTSGSGKSSLLRGGVIPRLQASAPGRWRVAELGPGERGGDGCEALTAALRAALGAAEGTSAEQALAGLAAEERLLILVDDFQEVFERLSPEEGRRFTRLLWRLSCDVRVVAVAALQIEALGRGCEVELDDSGLRLDAILYDDRSRILLRPPGPAALRAIAEGPAEALGLSFEPGLVERLVADAEGQPGSLPLLEHALDELWRRRRGRVLTFAAYAEIGGLGGALARSADAALDALDPAARGSARRVLTGLVTFDEEGRPRRRRQVALAELLPDAPQEHARFARVVAHLAASRLIVADAQTLDLAHEALIRGWPRLQAWVEEDREPLREAARLRGWYAEWLALADRPDEQRAFLDAKDRLEEVQRLAARHPELVQGPLRAFAAEAQWLADAERQRTIRQRSTLSFGIGLSGCTWALATGPPAGWIPTAAVTVALITALSWELGLAERVSLDRIRESWVNAVLHAVLMVIGCAGFQGALAAGDPRLTWALVALALVRAAIMGSLVLEVPAARRWGFLGLGPALGCVVLVAAVLAPGWTIAGWWAAAFAEQGVTFAIYRRRHGAAPTTFSEGIFVATLGRMQEILVVATSVVVLVAYTAPTASLDLGVSAPAAMAVVLLATAGHGVRYGVELPELSLRRTLWEDAIMLILLAMIVHAAAAYRMIAGAADDPTLRWVWAGGQVALLFGMLVCAAAIEPGRRRGPGLPLLAAQLPVPVIAAALTIDATTATWGLVQCGLSFLVLMPEVQGRGGQVRVRA